MAAPSHTAINLALDALAIMEPIADTTLSDRYPDIYNPDVQATVEERLSQIIFELNRASRFVRSIKPAQIETLIGGVADEINGFMVTRGADSPSTETAKFGDIWLQPNELGTYTPRVFNGTGFVENLYAVDAILLPIKARLDALESDQAEIFQDAIDALKAELRGAASAGMDTFAEVETAITALTAALAAQLVNTAHTGIPTAPTAAPGTDTTQIATTAFANAAAAAAANAVVAAAPGALDTLNELSAALGDDANFAASVTAALAGKQATLTGVTGVIDPATGAARAIAEGDLPERILWARAKGPSFVDLGYFLPDPASPDWDAAFSAAGASNAPEIVLPPLTIRPTDRVDFVSHKTYRGSGRGLVPSVLLCDPSVFNMSAAAFTRVTGAEPGARFENIHWRAVQPDTATRGSLNEVPVALDMRSIPRVEIDRCQVTLFVEGIDMSGNTGGARIRDLDIACFDRDIFIDGALDSVRITGAHHWPRDMTANQAEIMKAGKRLHVGRCDDLKVTDPLYWASQRSVVFEDLGSGGAYGTMIGAAFDSGAGLEVLSPGPGMGMTLLTPKFSIGVDGRRAIKITGGLVTLVSPDILLASATLTDEQVQIDGAAQVQWTGGLIRATSAADIHLVKVLSSNALLTMDGVKIDRAHDQAYAKAFVDFGSGAGRFSNNRMVTARTTGSGTMLAADVDKVEIFGNRFNGWAPGAAGGWKTFSPAPVGATGSTGTAVVDRARYRRSGEDIEVDVLLRVTDAGDWGTGLVWTLPAAAADDARTALVGRNAVSPGQMITSQIANSATTSTIINYDNTNPIATGAALQIRGSYRAAA